MTNKIDIAIIGPETLPIPPIRGGGIQTSIWETVKKFKKYKAVVYSGTSTKDTKKEPLCSKYGPHLFKRILRHDIESHLIRLRHLQFNNYFSYVYKIVKDINQIRPSIIHIHSRCWFLAYLKKLLNYRPKIILQHHNHYFTDMKDKQVNYYLKMIDAFVGVSNFTIKKEILNRFPIYSNKCFTIYNGVNLDKFKPKWQYQKEEVDNIKNKLQIPTQSKIITFVGRLSKQKGVLQLLIACKKLFVDYPDWNLVIAGSSWFGKNIENDFVKQLQKTSSTIENKIIFTGYIPHEKLPDLYAISDIFCAPSIMEEPFGLVFVEAQACGLPVLTSNRGGIPEIITEKTGIMIDNPEDPFQIFSQLKYLIDDPQKRLKISKIARSRIEQYFSWGNSAMQTEKLYDKILG